MLRRIALLTKNQLSFRPLSEETGNRSVSITSSLPGGLTLSRA